MGRRDLLLVRVVESHSRLQALQAAAAAVADAGTGDDVHALEVAVARAQAAYGVLQEAAAGDDKALAARLSLQVRSALQSALCIDCVA